MARILIVDDQRNMRTTLAMMLRGARHEVSEAGSGEEACRIVTGENYDMVLTDLKMAGKDGIEVLKHVRENAPLTEVIVMTAYGTVESAVQAMRLGAYDYLEKPFTEEELMVKVQKALERRWLSGEVSLYAEQFKERYRFESIVGRSLPIREVLTRVVKIAGTGATVLITGESGTGKELIAKAIHANSDRSARPFVPVNCAAISEQLLESELFGHVKGSFTGAVSTRKGLFEEADGGTFFFDEIADTTPSFQAKLLRAIQDKEVRRVGDNKPIQVDVRIIAATNQDLKTLIEKKAFREDLYYRLNVARFHLPPLRERREDIPLLVEHFLVKHGKRMGRLVKLGPEVQGFLMQYEFPGNIRELENLIEQGIALCTTGEMTMADIRPDEPPSPKQPRTLADVVAQAERQAMQVALREEANLEQAAARLGLSTTTLWRKMKRLGVRRDSS